MFDQAKLTKHLADVETWLADEYKKISAGLANPSMLDNISVESYGTQQPIKNIASIHIESPRTLLVSPWNRDDIVAIETSIRDSKLPFSISADSSGVRVTVPDLTEESRRDIIKIINEKHEEARVRVRATRHEAMEEIEKIDGIGDDKRKSLEKEVQKEVDEANKELDEIRNRRESAILTI